MTASAVDKCNSIPYRGDNGSHRDSNQSVTTMVQQSNHNENLSTKFAQSSSLYQEFLAERQEILRHKWIESEKVGYDIGFERALLDWIRNHRERWRVNRRNHSQD